MVPCQQGCGAGAGAGAGAGSAATSSATLLIWPKSLLLSDMSQEESGATQHADGCACAHIARWQVMPWPGCQLARLASLISQWGPPLPAVASSHCHVAPPVVTSLPPTQCFILPCTLSSPYPSPGLMVLGGCLERRGLGSDLQHSKVVLGSLLAHAAVFILHISVHVPAVDVHDQPAGAACTCTSSCQEPPGAPHIIMPGAACTPQYHVAAVALQKSGFAGGCSRKNSVEIPRVHADANTGIV